ncbi:hypothetical protein [Flavobacterium pectinovorum]|uniref:Lipoprotein n=1 Tax=Flavobacterium pectinovorum TaxID=29533 RepID=A0A502EUH9_9FLAO|nr:hypothetical protein [Flavobacterium pectinovorum]TPG41548.1 hypothetical protein EAH81_08665 [Flavobacterium pectinovorum]
MQKYKRSKIILLFFFLLSFTSCETVSDCIVGIRPNLIAKELTAGIISIKYDDNITYEMLNTKTGEYGISSISIKDVLPPGINYSIVNNNKINFSGIPTTRGTYEFTISITVRPSTYNDDGTDDLCGDSTSKKYKIVIN